MEKRDEERRNFTDARTNVTLRCDCDWDRVEESVSVSAGLAAPRAAGLAGLLLNAHWMQWEFVAFDTLVTIWNSLS